MRASFPRSILCILVSFSLSILSAQDPERMAKLLERFPKADTNEDGQLSKDEFKILKELIVSQKSNKPAKAGKIEPTFPDIRYGKHERNVFDIWMPGTAESKSELPFPVLVFFHGGGFVGGSKDSFSPKMYLDAGIACVSANYRFTDGKESLSPTPMEDGAKVIQTLRQNAAEWNLDGGRLAVSGSSAGAVIAMWIAYHDDLARADAKDPVSRQSTRVTCAVPINGPTNLQPHWIVKNIGGSKQVHSSFQKMFGVAADSNLSAEINDRIKLSSPREFASEDDPPSLLLYNGPLGELPLPGDTKQGRIIHHPHFGKSLKSVFDSLGVECEFRHSFDPRENPVIINYLRNKFSMID